jgi:hypothetical protein
MKINKRKYLLSAGLLTVLYLNISAQISEGGFPPSFYYDQSLRSQKLTEVPVNFYVEDLRETDNWRAREGVPTPVAKLIDVDYSLDNSGEWMNLPGGERIWQLKLKAKDAVAIMLYYDNFYIPDGGRLFIYSPDKSQLSGAYTSRTNPAGGLFATKFIGGQELILEYVTSTESKDAPKINISQIGYGYNVSALKAFASPALRASSGTCEVNVNCDEGTAWQNEKRGVCFTIQKIGNVSYMCTGSLVNNTAQDFKPLILSARHCAYDGNKTATPNEMKQWTFYFNYELEGCNNNTPALLKQERTGCTLVARTETSGQSDGMLVLLNQEIPESWDVYYNGWDRREVMPNSGVCLHHPEGDYKKISTYGSPATIMTFESSEFKGDMNAHMNVTFMQTANGFGVTEAGSSGSPLFNESKLITGTLTGGTSSCYYSRGLNIYGRLYNHWDKYSTDSISQMSKWLDPLNTGEETLPGRYRRELKPAPSDLQAVNQGQAIYLSWKAPNGNIKPEKYNIYRNNQKIAETTELYYMDNDAATGINTYSVSAVYPDGEESAFITASASFIRYKAPIDLQAVRTSESRVRLSWQAPVYEQTIYWGSLEMAYQLGFDGDQPFYFGQKWQSSELAALNLNLIKAVQFVPVEKNTYQIYITQNKRIYRQDVDNSTLEYKELNTISLNEPFTIDASKDLIIAIYISSVGSDYPAGCDYGSAVNGKGNIFSEDGMTWYNLYNEDRPFEFNYNFIVAAIISSEKGVLSLKTANGWNEIITSQKSALEPRSNRKTQSLTPVADLRSSIPVLFPQITSYKIYRMSSFYVSVDGTETSYMDRISSNNYNYEVSAIYDNVESQKSNKAYISTVAVEHVNDSVDIFPSAFKNNVYLKGYEYSTRIDIVSANGKICLRVNNPGQTIDASSLTGGVYFFRIYGDSNHLLKVIKTVKVN